MEKKSIYQKMDNSLEILQRIPLYPQKTTNYSERKKLFKSFLFNTLDTYLFLKREPLLKSESIFKQYLEQTSISLSGNIYFLLTPVFRDLNNILNTGFQSNEWTRICQNRSAIEALREMYQGTLLKEYLEEDDEITIGLRDLDERIRQRGQVDAYMPAEQIPNGIPKSHWWWWL
jgi:hypothetical protein